MILWREKKRKKKSNRNDADATINDSKLDSSLVATGRGITQNLTKSETHYHAATQQEDRSRWPDVILECLWPSLIHERRIPGMHTVRKRPWTLRHQPGSAVYNVRIGDIDFGAYKICFPFPVATLTDAALRLSSDFARNRMGLSLPSTTLSLSFTIHRRDVMSNNMPSERLKATTAMTFSCSHFCSNWKSRLRSATTTKTETDSRSNTFSTMTPTVKKAR